MQLKKYIFFSKQNWQRWPFELCLWKAGMSARFQGDAVNSCWLLSLGTAVADGPSKHQDWPPAQWTSVEMVVFISIWISTCFNSQQLLTAGSNCRIFTAELMEQNLPFANCSGLWLGLAHLLKTGRLVATMCNVAQGLSGLPYFLPWR